MLNVLQLSDIHYGADYDGRFDTADQWAAVVADAHKLCPDGYDAVVITGDLVDDDPKVSDELKRERYKTIIADAASLRRNDKCPLLVTPGNHDNRKIFTEVVNTDCPCFQWGLKQFGGFNDVGGQCMFVGVGNKTLVVLDSGTVEPYKGIAKLAKVAMQHKSWFQNDTMVFTHKPFRTNGLYHRFMKDNLMSDEVGSLVEPYATDYFCGHFHHLATVDNPRMVVHACPGIQCQIDPYSKECNAIPVPGYQVISFESHANATVKVTPVILDDYVVKPKHLEPAQAPSQAKPKAKAKAKPKGKKA